MEKNKKSFLDEIMHIIESIPDTKASHSMELITNKYLRRELWEVEIYRILECKHGCMEIPEIRKKRKLNWIQENNHN